MFLWKIWLVLCWYLRPVFKWFLRKTTKLCELQRLCYGEKPGAPRVYGVEKSLHLSRNSCIKELIQHLDTLADNCLITEQNQQVLWSRACAVVMKVKKIDPSVHIKFGKSFEMCMQQIWGYRQLYSQVEALRIVQCDVDNPDHENRLLELWELLMPEEELWKLLMPEEELEARVSKQWQEIGFQGDDPKTDFRGMGLLGLENLLYFAKEYPGACGHVLSHSHHPKYGYTFAIVGINLTSMAYKLLKDGSAKTYVYNMSRGLPTIKLFHQLYCYLFYEFDRFWIEWKPQNMMEFSIIQENFDKAIRTALADKNTVFKINIEVDNV